MSKTVDELVRVYCDAFYAQRDKAPAEGITQADRAGIIAVVTALRDELVREFERCDCCSGIEHVEPFFEEILAPREGGQAAGGSTREDGRSVEQLGATSSHAVTAPAAPAPTVGQRLIKAAHEAAAIARGDMQPGRVHAASASVCEWKLSNEVGALGFRWLAEPIACGASLAHEGYAKALNMRCLCGLPIALKPEAQR